MGIEEQIFNALNTKLGKTSLSERTVRECAAQIAKGVADAEEITDSVINPYVDMLKVMSGQLSHDISDQLKEQLESKTKELEGKYAGGKTPDVQNPKADSTSDELKEELEKFKEIKSFYEKDMAERKAASEKAKYDSAVSGIMKIARDKELDSDLVDLLVMKNGIDPEKTPEENFKSMQGAYDSKVSERVSAGLMPMNPIPAKPRVVSDEERAKNATATYERLKNENKI